MSLEKIDPEIRAKGMLVCTLDGVPEMIEVMVMLVRAALGIEIDWGYFGGIAAVFSTAPQEEFAKIRMHLKRTTVTWMGPPCSETGAELPRSTFAFVLPEIEREAFILSHDATCLRRENGVITQYPCINLGVEPGEPLKLILTEEEANKIIPQIKPNMSRMRVRFLLKGAP